MHPWWRWECFENGFYAPISSNVSKRELEESQYMNFHLSEFDFQHTLPLVSNEWPFLFETFMLNDGINRIAWLGQVSICYKLGISSYNRGAYNRLEFSIRKRQNKIADDFIKRWISEFNKGVSGKIYIKLDEKRIRERDTRRSSASFNARKSGPVVQGDLFGNFE